MSWYNPFSWSARDVLTGGLLGGAPGAILNGGSGGKLTGAITDDPGADDERRRKELLYQQSQKAGSFADQTQQSYNGLATEAGWQRDALRRLATGQDSLAGEQLRQAAGRNQAMQMSMAAGAAPQNQAAAARTAAINAMRIGSGQAGQAAVAGIQERAAANRGLSDLIMQQRQQELQATQGARGQAMAGYSPAQAGTPEKSWLEKYGPAVQGGLNAIVMSDRRLKTDIEDGEADARKATDGLRAFAFRYRDGKHGQGRQVGVMAQDLERAGLGHAVVETGEGKAVHGAKLATANTAMIAALGRRVAQLEGRGKR